MFARTVFAAAGLAAVPAALSTVHAAETGSSVTSAEKNTPPDNKIFVHELPIYGEPPEPEMVYIPEKKNYLQENMKPISKFVMTGLEHSQAYISVLTEGQTTFSSTLTELLKYLRDDSGAVTRAAFITVTGLGGLVAGYRGGFIRKAVYASIGMAAAASICYPDQALDISKQAWILTKEQAKEFWRPARLPGENISKTDPSSSKQSENKAPSSDKDVVKVVDKPGTTETIKPKEDHGMSNPEDKDMYTTRSG